MSASFAAKNLKAEATQRLVRKIVAETFGGKTSEKRSIKLS